MDGEGLASSELLADLSLSRSILGQVSTMETVSAAWATIEGMFASQPWTRVISTKMALATTSKCSSSINEFLPR